MAAANLYMWPYSRFSVYVVGMVLGALLLLHHQRPIRMSRATQLIGWSFIIAIYLLTTFVPGLDIKKDLFYFDYEPTALKTAIFQAFLYTAQGVMAAWLIFTLATGHAQRLADWLTGPAWHAMANCNMMVYLIHPLVISAHAGLQRERPYWSHYQMAQDIAYIELVCYVVAIPLQLLLATPVEYLLQQLLMGAEEPKADRAVKKSD